MTAFAQNLYACIFYDESLALGCNIVSIGMTFDFYKKITLPNSSLICVRFLRLPLHRKSRRTYETTSGSPFRMCISFQRRLKEGRRTYETTSGEPFRMCISFQRRLKEGRRTYETTSGEPFRMCISFQRRLKEGRRTYETTSGSPFRMCISFQRRHKESRRTYETTSGEPFRMCISFQRRYIHFAKSGKMNVLCAPTWQSRCTIRTVVCPI